MAETTRLAERGGGWLLLLGMALGTFTAFNEDQARSATVKPPLAYRLVLELIPLPS